MSCAESIGMWRPQASSRTSSTRLSGAPGSCLRQAAGATRPAIDRVRPALTPHQTRRVTLPGRLMSAAAPSPSSEVFRRTTTCRDLIWVGSGSGSRNQRLELLKGLAKREDRHMVFLTATPHSGDDTAFHNLLALLDPAFAALQDMPDGPACQKLRERLAAHFVQRRRADTHGAWFSEQPTCPWSGSACPGGQRLRSFAVSRHPRPLRLSHSRRGC